MLRPRFIFWLLAVFICFLINQLIQERFVVIIILFLLSLPIFSVLYSFWIKRKLRVEIRTEREYINRGEDAVWYLRFNNNSRLQTMVVELLIRANTLSFGQNQLKSMIFIGQKDWQTVRLTIRPSHSGPFNIQNLSISVNDIFGFFRLKLYTGTELDMPNIYVLPLEEGSPNYRDYLSRQLEAGAFPAGKSQILMDEIDRFRSMEPGDSLKLIHWKLSAKMQEWMVKQFDKEDDKSVTVLLNLPEIYFKSYNQESDRLLHLRDFMLDHTYTAILIFLSRMATVRLKTYQPELVIEEAVHVKEADLLKKQLAFIPYRQVVSFENQLQDEKHGNEQNILYVLTYDLTENLVTELRSLRPSLGAMLLVYTVDSQTALDQAAAYIKQLEDAEITVEIAKSYEVNLYA